MMISSELEVREKYFQETFSYSLSSDSIKESEIFLDRLLSFLSVPVGASVLVLPCLEGNYALLLKKKGMKVTGCTDHASSLEVCQRRAKEENLDIEWIMCPPFDFCLSNRFHLILNLDYLFGTIRDSNLNQKILRNFYKSLLPNGKIVMQLMGRDLLEKYFHPKYWIQMEDGSYLLNERSLDLNGWLEENHVLIKDDNIQNFRFGQYVYYPNQFIDLLEDCQFKKVQIFGDVDGSPYNDRSQSLIIIAEKLSDQFLIRC